MIRYTAAIAIAVSVLNGCGPASPSVSLKDVNPTRVYTADKTKLLDAMRMYCAKYDFTLRGIEPETGRVRAFRRAETLREEEGRTILMLVYVTDLPGGRSRVEAKFVYDRIEGTPTRQDETTLVDCYTSLFRYLDNEMK